MNVSIVPIAQPLCADIKVNASAGVAAAMTSRRDTEHSSGNKHSFIMSADTQKKPQRGRTTETNTSKDI